MVNDFNKTLKHVYAKSSEEDQPTAEVSKNYLTGWVCPKCGAVMGPWQNCCIRCTPAPQLTWSTPCPTYDINPNYYDVVPYWELSPTCVCQNTKLNCSYSKGDSNVKAFSN